MNNFQIIFFYGCVHEKWEGGLYGNGLIEGEEVENLNFL